MKRGESSKNKGRIPTSKPFCDCRHCECKNCPDIVQKLAISIKDSKGGFRGKGAKRKKCSKDLCSGKGKRASQTSEHRPSILDMLNPDRNCDCEIMARAIRSHIHMNIGMSERRTIHSDSSEQKPSNSKDVH